MLHYNTVSYFSDASPVESKETPFQTTLQLDDVTYSLRHVEESWIHLLKAGMRRISAKKQSLVIVITHTCSLFMVN
jgi:hypothetical protein